MRLETIGKKISEVPVEISYRIIELFSAGLYSSPNKAFEELVSNSYDALATKVAVYVPSDPSIANSFLWVCDNGMSMDSNGLKMLWRIGSSGKRELENKVNPKRLQIGKFGIGKLATYVLARKLTYICKNKGEYRAVTMDYSMINRESEKAETILLDERELKEEQVKEILSPVISINGRDMLSFDLWGKKSEPNWTFAIMSDLTPKATEIKEGRLKWVLKTALPINPNFNLFFNGEILLPEKQVTKTLKTWIIGEADETAERMGFEQKIANDKPSINLSMLKNVHGEFELYNDSLITGKSEKLGRSHGVFLMVRGRLINTDDPLLGMDAFSHGAFNRCRIVIHADDLDEYITSTRESIIESKALSELKEYIKKKFNNELREFWIKKNEEDEKRSRAVYKVSTSSGSLSRRPLLVVARRFFNHEITNPILISVPNNLSPEQKEKFILDLEKDLTSEEGIIKDIKWETLEPANLLAHLDLQTRTVKVNLMHPFFANFSEDVKTAVPFQLIAITEILTEAYLIELGIDEDTIRKIMLRRDQILRELTYSDKPNAPVVATMLKDSLADSVGLEDAVYQAFNNLGFATTKIGGSGKPDGLAQAILGYDKDKYDTSYSVVYDAKSTAKEKISAATAKISTSVRHRTDYKARYSVVIARDFEGAQDPNSAVSKEAKHNKVTLIRASDLMKLILLSAPKQIGLLYLEDFFKNCHTVIETSAWIEKIKKREIPRGPIKELLETVFQLQKDDTEPPLVAAIRMSNPTLKELSIDGIKSLIQSLEQLAPHLIKLEGEIVSLQVPADKILTTIHQVITTSSIPPEFRDSYLNAFEVR